uniref:Endothelin-1 n=1 Tax=Geotrypetes seraphini TaxID=260995 RepID=A0A6P8PS16_GEOSA|nr:endothelin-1 [Geotrypetes seraphini]
MILSSMDLQTLLSLLAVVICQGAFQAASVSVRSFSRPDSGLQATAAAATFAPRSPGSPWRPRRPKRCSCSSLMDKECVYFCHLDIIWINTPERTVSYGLGGPRSKRSLRQKVYENLSGLQNRCSCANQKDKKCSSFCQTKPELRVQSSLEKGGYRLHLFNKENDCSSSGLKCVPKQQTNNRQPKRSDAIRNAIQTSFDTAKLKARLSEQKKAKHNRAYKMQSIWEHLKTTP